MISRAMTVELWLRPAPSPGHTSSSAAPEDSYSYDEVGEGKVKPIFAIGTASSAESGLSGSGCDEGQYSLLVAQKGSELRVEVARSLQGRNGARARVLV